MPKSELATIFAQRASSPSEVIRRWLVIFGELYRQEITPALVEIWCRLLGDLEPEVLEEECEQTAKTSKFFPTPADIRALIDQAEEAKFEVEAEEAWNTALEYARRFYYPDWGVRDALPLPQSIDFAAKAAGGWRRLHMCSEDELVWCRKTFLDRYNVLHKTGQSEHLLLAGDSGRILGELKKFSPKHLAPAPAPASCGPEQEQKGAREVPPGTVAELPTQIATPEPVPHQPPSEEELERRRQHQKRGLQDWLAARSKQGEKELAAVEGA